jgi:enoyl-CoA hydratase/carnithine racemase
VRHLGYGRTLHLLTNHDSVNATDALQLALVDRVVEDADMEQEVRVCADRFAQIPGRSLVAMKRLLAAASDGLGTYLATEGGVFERWILEQ